MNWSSTLSFVVTSIGAAVGLGSLWFLPYQVYSYGGALFFLSFSIFTLTIGVAALNAEINIGYSMGSSLYKGLPRISPNYGRIIAFLFYLTLFLILSFYSIVTSQALYCFLSASGYLLGLSSNPLHWTSLIAPLESSLGLSLSILGLFWVLTYLVMSLPIQKGLEKFSWWLMIILVITLFILVINSARLGFLITAVSYMFQPSWKDFTSEALLAALGASLFGLAVGAGCMISYGAYLKEGDKRNILFQVFVIALSCLLISLLSCLSLFPYVLHHGITFTSGPKLVFEVLPVVFSSFGQIGSYLSALYLLALFSAGFTSCFSLIEPFLIWAQETYKVKRSQVTLFFVIFFFCASCALVLDNHLLEFNLMAGIIKLVTQGLLPLGVVCTAFLYKDLIGINAK